MAWADKPHVVPVEEGTFCPRLGRRRADPDHHACLYCFGGFDEIATGRRARFCDFQPGVDPILFGFPVGTSRDRDG